MNLLGPVSVTKIRVHSLIDAENLRRTTLHRTDIDRNLSLGAPDNSLGQNKKRNKRPLSRQINDKFALKPKCAFYSIIEVVEAGGSTFSFELTKIEGMG